LHHRNAFLPGSPEDMPIFLVDTAPSVSWSSNMREARMPGSINRLPLPTAEQMEIKIEQHTAIIYNFCTDVKFLFLFVPYLNVSYVNRTWN